jgi:hypothetical protein
LKADGIVERLSDSYTLADKIEGGSFSMKMTLEEIGFGVT